MISALNEDAPQNNCGGFDGICVNSPGLPLKVAPWEYGSIGLCIAIGQCCCNPQARAANFTSADLCSIPQQF